MDLSEKKCSKCEKFKSVLEFSKSSKKMDGLHPVCKSCDNQRRRNYHQHHRDDAAHTMRKWREGAGRKKILLNSARGRAVSRNIPFSLTEDDFEIPEYCPILGIKLATGIGRGPAFHSPTLDRIDPQLGYVPGNVQVISARANAMKNDATRDELQRFAAWVLKEFPEE